MTLVTDLSRSPSPAPGADLSTGSHTHCDCLHVFPAECPRARSGQEGREDREQLCEWRDAVPIHRRAVKSTKDPVDVSRKPSEKAEHALTVALLGVLWGRGLTPAGLQLQSTLKQGLSKFSQAGLELVSPLP